MSSAVERSWTALELLRWAQTDFSTRGLADARLSAEILLAHALSTSRVGLYLKHDYLVASAELDCFRALVTQRRLGKPVAYLTGVREFYGLSLQVSESVLIPRPETELLVDLALEALRLQALDSMTVCDVGTGSGAIALALKHEKPEIRMIAIDVSQGALATAEGNGKSLNLDVEWRESDLLKNVSEPLNMIVANLPYIPSSDLESLPVDVKDFEPRLALEAGEDGLSLIRRLIDEGAKKLVPPGSILLEIGIGQADDVANLLESSGFAVQGIRKDLAGIPRVVQARLGA